MVKKVRIGKLRLIWVFNHFWEKDRSITNWNVKEMRKRPRLGIWVGREKIVGLTKHGKNRKETVEKTFSSPNLVNEYMVGLDLIVIKIWVKLRFAPTLKLKFD